MQTLAPGVLRVVVRPPNLPAVPPLSLLTQNNVEDTGVTVIDGGDNPERWVAGGGSVWNEPLRQPLNDQVFQAWPGEGGTEQTSKLGRSNGDTAERLRLSEGDQVPVQLPMLAAVEVSVGTLSDIAHMNTDGELSTEDQLALLFDAVLPRVIEHELWTGEAASLAAWPDQFRLKALGHVSAPLTAAVPVRRALAVAEQLAANAGFYDSYGGAFCHMSPLCFQLVTSPAELLLTPPGPRPRQVSTLLGTQLIPELGATGTWDEDASDAVAAKPGGSVDGDNLATGWMFITPPVRVRLGPTSGRIIRSTLDVPTNDQLLVGERAFTIECSIREELPTSIAVPVDFTQEL